MLCSFEAHLVGSQDANGIDVGSVQMAIKFDTLGGGGNSKPTVATGAPPLQVTTILYKPQPTILEEVVIVCKYIIDLNWTPLFVAHV